MPYIVIDNPFKVSLVNPHIPPGPNILILSSKESYSKWGIQVEKFIQGKFDPRYVHQKFVL
jgi:hypothetical protein